MTTSSLIAPVREPPQLLKHTFFVGGNVGAYSLTCGVVCVISSVNAFPSSCSLSASCCKCNKERIYRSFTNVSHEYEVMVHVYIPGLE